MKHFFLFLYLFLFPVFFAEAAQHVTKEIAYPYNPYVKLELWNTLVPYFLPKDHPIKEHLDKIFLYSGKRVVKSKKSLEKFNFRIIQNGKRAKPCVVSHRLLKGYLLKLYTDEQVDAIDGLMWRHRIHGTQVIQQAIDKHGCHTFFKVPKKWIYPLPTEPSPSKKYQNKGKNFILVVEDMRILSRGINYSQWQSPAMTLERLQALYTVLDEAGLADSTYIFNIPFSYDGKMAFIDTECYHVWPVDFSRLTRYFSREGREFWKMLMASR